MMSVPQADVFACDRSPAVVAAFCETHTTAEAAVHFHCNERTIRKKLERHRARVAVPDDTPDDTEIAGDATEWIDPWTGDPLPIVPGTVRVVWEAERLAARDRKALLRAPDPDPEPTPEPDVFRKPDPITNVPATPILRPVQLPKAQIPTPRPPRHHRPEPTPLWTMSLAMVAEVPTEVWAALIAAALIALTY